MRDNPIFAFFRVIVAGLVLGAIFRESNAARKAAEDARNSAQTTLKALEDARRNEQINKLSELMVDFASDEMRESMQGLKRWKLDKDTEGTEKNIPLSENYFAKEYERLMSEDAKDNEINWIDSYRRHVSHFFRRVRLYRQNKLVNAPQVDEGIGLDVYDFLIKTVWPIEDAHARAEYGKGKADPTMFEYFQDILRSREK